MKRTRSHVKVLSEISSQRSTSVSSTCTDAQSAPNTVMKHPLEWQMVLQNIRTMRSKKDAPVDSMGCEKCSDKDGDPKLRRLQTLVSLMLSSQTKDEVNFAAMGRLKERGLSVDMLLKVDENELAQIIYPVGFYKRKANYLKKVAGIIRERYEDDIPRTLKELCELPGVGPKMAHICMRVAWNELSGIGVDTHVHRISNRLGWTGANGTETPEETRQMLESWLPRDLWAEINELLVGFGQQICTPVKPHCGDCLNRLYCPFGKNGGAKTRSRCV